MSRCWRTVAVVFGFLLLLVGSTAAEDWPRFRGMNGAGVSRSEDVPASFGPQKNVIWKVESGQGSSSPVVADGALFFSSFDGDVRTVHCLDAKTGAQRWRKSVQKVREEVVSAENGPATCTLAADGDNVVAFFPDAGLVCYSSTGDQRWRIDVGPFHSMHGISNSPLIARGRVVLLADQLKGSFLAAFDLATGQEVWKLERMDGLTGGYSTPSLLERKGHNPLVVTSGPEGLSGYEIETGKTAFTVPGVTNAPVTVPLVARGKVFVCEPLGTTEPIDRMLPMFDKNDDGNISLEEAKKSVAMYRMLERMDKKWGNGDGVVEPSEWDEAFGSFIDKGGLVAVSVDTASDVPEAQVAWTYDKAVPYVASPVLYDDVMYFIQDGGILASLDPDTGKILKRARLKAGGGRYFASPVAADGKIFLIDRSGEIAVVKAGGNWQELANSSLGEICFATPAICDGRIFVRTQTTLYCFGSE